MFNKLRNEHGSYSVEMEVNEIAILKATMVAFGALVGMLVPNRSKKGIAVLSGTVFASGAFYLLYKFFTILAESPFDEFEFANDCDCGCNDDIVDFDSLYTEKD